MTTCTKKLLRIIAFLWISTSFFLTGAEEKPNQQTILFTHDMHDHFLPVNALKDGKVVEMGGYTRLKTAIDIEKQKDPGALLVDGGDFSMGTLFQTIFTTEAPGLTVLGEMGYDATTLGNHEFDFRAQGLADSLIAASKKQGKMPEIVQANMIFPTDENNKMKEDIASLQEATKAYEVKPYTIIEKDNNKIGIFGLMGIDADSNAPMAGVDFLDPIEEAKKVVKLLKEEKVDMIICLSHSGTTANPKKSEDELLAKKVPEIDVIISGHTHTALPQPIKIGHTTIVSAGEYSDALGILKVEENQGDWKVVEYRLELITEDLKEDITIVNKVNDLKKKVQEQYLDFFNLSFDQVIANSNFHFVPANEIGWKHEEEPLGNLFSDAYRYAVKQAEGEAYEPIAVTIVPSGTMRGSFTKGPITLSDVFTASSLGIGEDKLSGYPLVSAYLTGKELKTACEVDASIAPIMPSAQLYMSGLQYSFNPKRLLFNKVTDVKQVLPDGTTALLEEDKLYRVVVGLYSAQMLSVVGDKSFGLLSIVPKDKEGNPITDFETAIIRDNREGRDYEIKEWLAIATYMGSFDKIGHVPEVPVQYSQKEGRKIIVEDSNLWARVEKPNGIALGIYGIIVIVISIIIGFIIFYKKRKNKNRKR